MKEVRCNDLPSVVAATIGALVDIAMRPDEGGSPILVIEVLGPPDARYLVWTGTFVAKNRNGEKP